MGQSIAIDRRATAAQHNPMATLPGIANNPDIRFLGKLLGDVIRAYGGDALYARTESIRAASVQWRIASIVNRSRNRRGRK